MTSATRRHKCHQVTRLELELTPVVELAKTDRLAIRRSMWRHELDKSSEAIALMALETFYRRTRGIRADESLLAAALDNVLQQFTPSPHVSRPRLQQLIPVARQIVENRTQPRPWTTAPNPEGAASAVATSPAWR